MTNSQWNKPIFSLKSPEDSNLLSIQNLLKEVAWWVVFDVNDLVEDLWYRWISHLLWDIECSLMLDVWSANYSGFSLDWLRKIFSYRDLASKLEFLTIPWNIWWLNISQFVSEKNALWIKAKVFAVVWWKNNDKHGVLKMTLEALKSWVDWIVCSWEYASIIREVFWNKYNFEIVVWWDIKPKDAIKSWANHVILWDVWVESEEVKTALSWFNSEISWILPEVTWEHEFEELLYTWKWLELLKYIWAFYQRPEWWAFVKMWNWFYADWYLNIWPFDSNHHVLDRAWEELALKLKQSWIEWDLIVWTQVWSIRLSSYLALRAWFWESIYLEKWATHQVSFSSFRDIISSNKSDEEKEKELKEVFNKSRENWITLIKHWSATLKWKKIILNEYMLTPWLLENIINFIRDAWWIVVAVVCIWNVVRKTEIEGVPIISCFEPPAFRFYAERDNISILLWKNVKPLPTNPLISYNPKSDWKWLVDSMRNKTKRD